MLPSAGAGASGNPEAGASGLRPCFRAWEFVWGHSSFYPHPSRRSRSRWRTCRMATPLSAVRLGEDARALAVAAESHLPVGLGPVHRVVGGSGDRGTLRVVRFRSTASPEGMGEVEGRSQPRHPQRLLPNPRRRRAPSGLQKQMSAVDLTPQAEELLAERGYDPVFGTQRSLATSSSMARTMSSLNTSTSCVALSSCTLASFCRSRTKLRVTLTPSVLTR